MLIIKAFHILAMVSWFAGLFYLPRLFVYHADAKDEISLERFKLMEWRLYYAITWPAAILTTIWGLALIHFNPSYYLYAAWMQVKIALVLLLWIYHLSLGHYLRALATERSKKRPYFFRLLNEVPTVLLIGIVILVVVKPF